MVTTVRLQHVEDRRFPRWGYLDKFDRNEYMARSFVLTVVLHLAVLAAYLSWKELAPERSFQPPARGPSHEFHVMPDPQVIPLPPRIAPRPHVAPDRGPRGVIEPVEDSQAFDGLNDGAVSFGDNDGEAGPGAKTWFEDAPIWSPPQVLEPEIFIVVEVEPVLIQMQKPKYPELARDAGVEGNVVVRVLVGEDGTVGDTRIIQSVPLLDAAARSAAQSAIFKPAVQAGRAVSTWVIIPISFSLYE